jgi:hypothetical protein
MHGPALAITSLGDLLMWGGLAALSLLGLWALIYPKLSHH